MNGRWTRRAAVCAAVLLAAVSLPACTTDAREEGGDREAMRQALRYLHDAGSFRMVGELRAADGTRTTFDARLDDHGNCTGTIGRAESRLVGTQVWTRWEDAALPDAVQALHGGPFAPLAPTAPEETDAEWAATRLLRGTYLVTRLPGGNPHAEGLAPVCRAGRLLAGAGSGDGVVSGGPVTERAGERLRPLTRTTGPVTVRVYVPARGKPTARLAEYAVDGGRTVSARFSQLGQPVTVVPPDREPTVSESQVLDALGQASRAVERTG